MSTWFASLHPITQALLAGLFTWGVTAVGAASVFLARRIDRRLLDSMLGFSGGVMLAASYWSLLAPAIEISRHTALTAWLPPTCGFLLGGAVLWILDSRCRTCTWAFPSGSRGAKDGGTRRPCSSRQSPCTTSRKGWRSAWRLEA
jgi:zinc transporter ZupT